MAPAAGAPRKGPTVWTVDVPAGWEVINRSGQRLNTGAERRAVLELYRARVQLEISRELLRQHRMDGPALITAQQRFARGCWLVRLGLQAGASPLHRIGPDGTTLAESLEKLQQQNKPLLTQHHRQDV